jgi:predicted nuclease of predicted toxin-antitoxin system
MQTLDDAGHEVLRLRDHIPPDSVDPVVISKAQELNAILVSLNGDFADIVTYPAENYKGIIQKSFPN